MKIITFTSDHDAIFREKLRRLWEAAESFCGTPTADKPAPGLPLPRGEKRPTEDPSKWD